MNVILTPEQIFTLGLIASVLVTVLRFVYEALAKQKVTLPDWVMLVIVYIVSLVTGVLWFPQALPTLPIIILGDPIGTGTVILTYVTSLLVVLTAYTTSAAVIYAFVIQKVKDGLSRKFLPKLYPTFKLPDSHVTEVPKADG